MILHLLVSLVPAIAVAAIAAAAALLLGRRLPVSPNALAIAGTLGLAAGFALEFWLFANVCPWTGAVAYWTALSVAAFGSGVLVSALKAPLLGSIFLALVVGAAAGFAYTFAGTMNGAFANVC